MEIKYEDINSNLKPCFTTIYLYVNNDTFTKYKVGLIIKPDVTDPTKFIIQSKKEFIHVFKSYEPAEKDTIYQHKDELWNFISTYILGTFEYKSFVTVPGAPKFYLNNNGQNYGIRFNDTGLGIFLNFYEYTGNPLSFYQQFIFNGFENLQINLEIQPSAEIVLKPLLQKNYLFNFGSHYFDRDTLNNIDTKLKTNYSGPIESLLSNIPFEKSMYSISNLGGVDVSELATLPDLFALRHLADFSDPNLHNERVSSIDPIPYYNSEKSFYFQYVEDDEHDVNSEINILLRIPDELLDSNSPYYLDTDNINSVVVFNYNNYKIGQMNFSETGRYFYTTISNELPQGITDFSNFRYSFVFQFVNKNEPITINSPNLIIPPPILPTNDDLENSNLRTNIHFEDISTVGYTLPDSNSFPDDNIVFNLLSDEFNEEIALYDVYLKLTSNSKEYYIFVESINNLEFKSNEKDDEIHNKIGIKISFISLLKFLPKNVDDSKDLNIILIPISGTGGDEITFPLKLDNFGFNFETLRRNKYGKPLIIINHNSNRNITTGDLETTDFIIYKEIEEQNSTITDEIVESNLFSRNYYYNIEIKKNDTSLGTGNSFTTNYYINLVEKRRRRRTTINYYNLFSVYYTKDLIINDIVTELDISQDYLGDNTVQITFKNSSDTIININQEIKSFDTVVEPESLEQFIDENIEGDDQVVNEFSQALEELLEVGESVNINVESINITEDTTISSFVGAELEEDGSVIVNSDDITINSLSENNISVVNNDIIKFAYDNTDGSRIFKIIEKNKNQVFTIKAFNKNGVWRSQTIGEGSLIIESKLLISYLFKYNLDENEFPGNEVNSINYSSFGFRLYSESNITAKAILYENIDLEEPVEITLNIYTEVGDSKTFYFVDISEYSEDTFNILQSGSKYRIYINQEGKTEKYFDLVYNVSGKEYDVNESLIDEDLGISFSDSLKINSYLNYWYNQNGNMINLLSFLQNNYSVVSSANNITYNDNNIGELQFIFTNNNSITIGNRTYTLEELFDSTITLKNNYYNIELKGLGKDGSGIVQLQLLSNSTIPCVTGDTLIRTPHGDKPISEITQGELVRTDNGENVPVVKKMVRKCFDVTKMPIIIPKDYYGINKPNKDLYISSNHAIKLGKNIWKYPTGFNKLENNYVTYYNLKLPDYHKHQYIANNIPVESWNDGDNNIRKYKWIKKGNNIKKIFL